MPDDFIHIIYTRSTNNLKCLRRGVMEVMCQVPRRGAVMGDKALSRTERPEDIQDLWEIRPKMNARCLPIPSHYREHALCAAHHFLGLFLGVFGLLFALKCGLKLWSPESSVRGIPEGHARSWGSRFQFASGSHSQRDIMKNPCTKPHRPRAGTH